MFKSPCTLGTIRWWRLWFAHSFRLTLGLLVLPGGRRTRLSVAALLLATSLPALGDEYDTMRLKWFNNLTGGTNLDLGDTNIQNAVNSVANSANSYWGSLVKTPGRTNLWNDLLSTNVSAQVTTAFSRLYQMALGYAVHGSSLETNATLALDIANALDWMNANRYNQSMPKVPYDNWWDWQIGSPMALDDTCVLLYDYLTPAQLASYMNAVSNFTPVPDMTEANLVWKARVVGLRGALVKSSSTIASARNAFSLVFPYVTSGDGYYQDGSYIQHTRHPYTGGYGAALIQNLAPLMLWLSGSSWQITDPAQSNVVNWVYATYEPLIYRGATMDMVRGREISRSGASDHGNGQGIMQAILQVAQFAPPADAARMKSMVKYTAQTDTSRNFAAKASLPLIMAAEQLLADTNVEPRGELVGHFTFADMDRVVHLRPGFGFGLSMYSSRIYTYESINGENLHGWHTGDGMTYLYNGDLLHFSGAYWPTINPYRMPGTTVDTLALSNGANQTKVSGASWVGGATLGLYGLAGMQVAPTNYTSLVAKKSWFMFDNEIVCLGADISSTSNRKIETIVENRRLTSAGNNMLTVNSVYKPAAPGWSEVLTNPTWAHLAGNVWGNDIGYYFPAPATLNGLRETRTGAWYDINSNYSTALLTNNYLTLWYDHGTNPAGASYAYALLPNMTAAQVAAYAASPEFTVLENSSRAQGVQETTLGITAVNFWQDGSNSLGGITVDKKCSVMMQNDGTWLQFGLSDPTQTNTATINVTLDVSARGITAVDSGVTVLQTSPAIKLAVTPKQAPGQTFHASFFVGLAQTNALGDVADAYVQNDVPTNNYGTSTALIVKLTSGTLTRESYLRFDLASVTSNVVGAVLQLMPLTVSDPVTNAIATVSNDTWGEMSLTWSNKPASDAPFATWSPQLSVPVQISVLPQVQAALAADRLLSLRLYSQSLTTNGYVAYGSRENGTAAYQPQLLLTLGHLPPTVALTNPPAGSRFGASGPVTLGATAVASSGKITNMAFYCGATLLGQVAGPPYQLSASNFAPGQSRLTAVATDDAGVSATSAPVPVNFYNTPAANAGATSTVRNSATNIDLWTLASDLLTPKSNLLFTVGGASNGTVTLLADGHTARFTPAANYSGPAQFNYTVSNLGEDPRLLLHYSFEPPDDGSDGVVLDSSGNGRYGTLTTLGTGAYAYTNVAPQSNVNTASLQLVQNSTLGAACVSRDLSDMNLSDCSWTFAGWFQRLATSDEDFLLYFGNSDGYGGGGDELTLYCPSGQASVRLEHYNSANALDVQISSSASLPAGKWQHVALTFQRTNTCAGILRLYTNGVPVNAGTGVAWALQTQSWPVVFGGHNSGGNLQRFFNGRLDDLVLFTNALSTAEIATLASWSVTQFGGAASSNIVSVTVLSPNTPPTLGAISNRTLNAGMVLAITNVALDTDAPPQTLTFSLPIGPTNAILNTNGLLTWRPTLSQAGTSNRFTVVVTDSGIPNLSATQTFTAAVNPLNPARVALGRGANGQFQLTINGDTGPDYTIQSSTNLSLTNWTTLSSSNSPGLPWKWTDADSTNLPRRFYRLLLGP